VSLPGLFVACMIAFPAILQLKSSKNKGIPAQ
jgi:hypothetical protein